MTLTNTITVELGCEPQARISISENGEGGLFISIDNIDGIDPEDIDGLFFDLVDEGLLDSALTVFPFENTGPITGFDTGDDDQTTLANGATVAEGYDVSLQFGEQPDSTEGTVTGLALTLYSDTGVPLTVDDIDTEKLALVVNSDGDDGKVLLPNDGSTADDGTDDDDPDSNACEFTITDPSGLEVTLTLTELENGEVQVDVNMPDDDGAVIGDLRGIFFNVGDESKLDDMMVSGMDVTDEQFAANDVSNLGNGANMRGDILNQYGEFDAGVEIGTAGAGRDDLQSTSFVLSHPDGLSLADFEGQEFGVRLTSVGAEDGDRDGSLKLVGTCEPTPPVEECEDEYDVLYQSVMVAETPEEDAPVEAQEDEPELELL